MCICAREREKKIERVSEWDIKRERVGKKQREIPREKERETEIENAKQRSEKIGERYGKHLNEREKKKVRKRERKFVLLSITLISNGVDYFSLFGLLVYHHIKLAIRVWIEKHLELSLSTNIVFNLTEVIYWHLKIILTQTNIKKLICYQMVKGCRKVNEDQHFLEKKSDQLNKGWFVKVMICFGHLANEYI